MKPLCGERHDPGIDECEEPDEYKDKQSLGYGRDKFLNFVRPMSEEATDEDSDGTQADEDDEMREMDLRHGCLMFRLSFPKMDGPNHDIHKIDEEASPWRFGSVL